MLEKSRFYFPKLSKSNYQPQSQDTNIEADVYLFTRLRQLTLKQRLEMFISHEKGVKKLCLVGIKSRHRNFTIQEIRDIFTRAVLGEKFTPDFQPKGINENMWIQDSISLAGELHQIFESINICYYVSGGVASSIHGEPRSTRDLDLVIEVNQNKLFLLVKTLETSGYYCPAGAVEDLQLGYGNMLNITHTETIANADIYITDNSPFAISQMNRRVLVDVEEIPTFWIASAEDIILQKLRWGKGSKSEKQWRDVLGIVKLQAENLDYGYLGEWAEFLDLVDEFSEVLNQAGI
ncbi:hypothetical protein H6G54_12780 [Anabaena cylindrica FACHB-243]|uniref:Uncharacterized protein n=1 Tax=Anabaena cylindrica (strain ATCC 27899 / PCC 7122) TaxID=272123 RepID=K9ZBF6_ANACC|nr:MULTISPECIES: hypothetical protein [Anabaena]AFZ56521.1 hypothetical protein Anacy_0946 [Anabaena cylindrica PCC 7122]MBD2418557.1 hypothetical protein [Anabaena cylindrica FACHB-243]MBY5285707.1 hypothetical protein [Anabaena sp. CCAP 1446/1C]MBY5311493.1 hypothetical protein [Anabaena sp. CCAP 1446/1C]MCM2409928.1 hypothetical protein [Anabaena sp. CCAP 1446/1C]